MINTQLERTRFNPVDNARGLVIYCYVPTNESPDEVMLQGRTILRSVAKKSKWAQLPVILVFVCDQGEIGKIMAELDAIEKLEPHEKEIYGKIASLHRSKREEALKENFKQALLQRNFVTTFTDDVIPQRLSQTGNFIFEKIFPKPLPFPFDGYKSTRTNAAKDCTDFTRKLLFTDGFSTDSIQSMPMQQRNRAERVLNVSWKIFNRDGSVAMKPGQANARSIVAEWEKLLSGNKELNCGKALEIACTAPYGANIASAGLLLAVYVQACQKILTLVENNEHVEFSTVGDRLFEGNVFSVKTLSGLTIFKKESSASEWSVLLTEWENADSYVQLTEFADQADELQARIKIPREVAWKERDLRRKSEEAKAKIEEADEKEDKYLRMIESASQKQDVLKLSYGASLLQGCGSNKMGDPMWRPEDYSLLVDKINEAKQIIIQHFEDWLNHQRPSSGTSAALAEFKEHLVGRVRKNLKHLDLKIQSEKLGKYYERISEFFEKIAECQQDFKNVDTWLASNENPSSDTTLAQFDAIEIALLQHLDSLKRQKSIMGRIKSQETLLSEVNNRIETLSRLHKKLQDKVKEIKAKASAIWDSSLSPETVDEVYGAVQDLERLYTGADTDVEDFRVMKSVIQFYLQILHSLKSTSISENDFKAQVATSRNEFQKRFESFEHPWDLDEVLDLLEKACVEFRKKASQEWLKQIQERSARINTMTTAQATELLRDINNPPPYVDSASKNHSLEKAREKVEQFLCNQEVDWLLERFKQMTESARKEFFKAATEFLKKHAE